MADEPTPAVEQYAQSPGSMDELERWEAFAANFQMRWRWVALVLIILAGLVVGLSLSRALTPRPLIGIVRFNDIIDDISKPYFLGPLDIAAKRGDIAAVVILIDSPGGDATISEEMFFRIQDIRQSKPVVASIERYGASGAYYAAAAANYIIARPAAQVGSIGVISSFPPNVPPDESIYTTGPFKASGRSSIDLMRDVELVKQTFLSHVYDERAYTLEHMHTPSRLDVLPDRESLATGQIWIGTRAYQIGLVDAVGSNEDAIAKAASLAGISHYDLIDLLNVYLGDDQEYLGYYSNLRSDWLENGPWVRLYHLYVAPGD